MYFATKASLVQREVAQLVVTEGLCKHTDRRGRRSLQGQQVALLGKFHQTLGRRFQQNSKKFGRVPNLFALTGDAGACGTPAMSN